MWPPGSRSPHKLSGPRELQGSAGGRPRSDAGVWTLITLPEDPTPWCFHLGSGGDAVKAVGSPSCHKSSCEESAHPLPFGDLTHPLPAPAVLALVMGRSAPPRLTSLVSHSMSESKTKGIRR